MGDSPGYNIDDHDPFYVGYLPLPKTIKRFILPWLAGNLVLAVCIAAFVAQQHREPGDGVWDTSGTVTIEGILTADPYPLLRTTEGKTYILVEQGKIGVQQRLAEEQIDAGHVSVTGFLIEREGRTILELDGSLANPIDTKANELTSESSVREERPSVSNMTLEAIGRHTLRGEIVDPKCYLGAMQPGDGKTHKVCATLCIKGGIPPMLLVRDGQGATAAYLLTDAEGDAFPVSHHDFIADPIEVTGQVLRDGDLLLFRADLGTIVRLGVGD